MSMYSDTAIIRDDLPSIAQLYTWVAINRAPWKAIFARTMEALIAADKSIPSSLPQYGELINRHVRVSY